MPERQCRICDKPFRPVGTPNKWLCSIDCRSERLRRELSGRPPKQQIVPCTTCGTELSRKPSAVSPHNFCSQKCKNEWMAEAYPQKITQPMRLARLRDADRCVICQFDVLVEVHHIIPKREGGADALDNLITLCPNHHTMADRGLLTRGDLLKFVPASPPLDETLQRHHERRQATVGSGRRPGNRKLTEAQVLDIRLQSSMGMTAVQLAEQFGVSAFNVHMIVSGKSWKHLLPNEAPGAGES